MDVTYCRRDSQLLDLRKRVGDGTYRVDPRAVADAIVSGGWVGAAPAAVRAGEIAQPPSVGRADHELAEPPVAA